MLPPLIGIIEQEVIWGDATLRTGELSGFDFGQSFVIIDWLLTPIAS